MFDKARANKARRFIENLKHTKSPYARVPFILAPWQWENIIKPLYGTINEDGTRQYRTCLIMLPRKNGKSALASTIALYHLFADNEIGGEIYSAAVDREQATVVFNVAAQMVRQSPTLSRRCRIIDSQKRIINHKTQSFYKAIPADSAGSHGYNSSLVIYDELHAAKNRDLYDVLSTSGGTRSQPLLFIITTAGFDRHSILHEQYEYAKKVLDGVVDDPTFLPVIYELGGDADWSDEKLWFDCNPALGDFRNFDEMKAKFRKAYETPASENTFRRLYLNQWTSSETKWLSNDKWEVCNDSVDEGSLQGRRCYAGLDLSSNIDISAFVLVFPPEQEDEKYQVLCRFFIPEDNMRERSRKDRVPYDVWTREGFITTTPDNVIDYAFIKHQIFEDASQFDLQEIAFDSWNATQISIQLEEEGLTVVEFRQGYKTMSPAVKELEVKILSKKLAHGGNPVLTWMCSNIMIKQDPAGNIKFDKEKSTEKIDGMVALAMALDRAHRNEGSTEVDISFF